jgi:hypothetical protein
MGALMIASFYLTCFALIRIQETVMVIAGLLELFLRCLWFALKLAFRAIVWAAPRLWRGAVLAFEFALLFIEEWWRGPDVQEQREEFFRREEKPERVRVADPYQQALALLGLPPAFTQPELKRAYKRAIFRAHPDSAAGTGSTRAAQAVNGAYALVLRRHGWSR